MLLPCAIPLLAWLVAPPPRTPAGADSPPVLQPAFEAVFDPRGAPEAPDRIHGRVLGFDAKPAVGARVRARPRPRTGYPGLLDRDASPWDPILDPRVPDVVVQSDAEGRFSIPAEPGRVLEIDVTDGAGHLARVDCASAGERFDVRLAPPATLQLRVIEARGGQAIADVEVAAVRAEVGSLRQFARVARTLATARTDADGCAVLSNLPPGVVTLAVEPRAFGAASTLQLRVEAGAVRRLDVPVEATAHVVRGVVVDEQGAAVVGAEVDLALDFQAPVRTDAKGQFVLAPLVAQDFARYFVRASGRGTERVRLQAPIPRETKSVVKLRPERRVRGVCVDAAGHPLAGARVVVVNDPDRQEWPEASDIGRAESGADGVFLVTGLQRDAAHFLVAHHPRAAWTFRHMPLDESARDEVDIGALVLSEPTSLHGRLFDMGSTIQPGVSVTLCATPADRDVLRVGKSFSQPLETLVTSARADSLGRFRFEAVPAGQVSLIAQCELGSVRLPERRAVAGEPLADVDLHIVSQLARPTGAGILAGLVEGRALAPDGSPVACALVVLSPDDKTPALVRSTFTDERGAFRIANVAPARYWTVVERWEGLERASALLARKVIAAGETSTIGDLTLTPCVVVRGRIVADSGPSGRTWLVRASSEIHALATAVVESDAQGNFALSFEAGAPLAITVLPLAVDPSTPRGVAHAAPARETVVHLTATPESVTIRVP